MRRSILRACLLPLLLLAGCANEVTPEPTQCAPFDEPISFFTPAPMPVDLLLAIDNSRSMADKQAILALTVPDLVRGLVNPPCVYTDGNNTLSPNQPASGAEVCPDTGSRRLILPVVDLHIGVITTSIGGHGADSCPNEVPNAKECNGGTNLTNNDRGRLVARKDACSQQALPTYQNKGFLAWDPEGALDPQGESTIDDGMGHGLAPALRDMTIGTGQIGCGYESQLESIYRFLADPAPYESIEVLGSKATPIGVDQVLLGQRQQFLRPDSLLAILMLSDENDCSIKEYGQFYYAGQLKANDTNFRMPRARAICETDPLDECCKSCGQADGVCPHDPTCDTPQGDPALLTAEEDDINLRCWDQKRRFGIDFLYPTDRYVQAFTETRIPDRAGEFVPNPIFSDLLGKGRWIRDSSMVFVAGIVGVPWQDIARDPKDSSKGMKSAVELQWDLGGYTAWDAILGDPATGKKPLDPLMRESVEKRQGTNPITGDVLVDASTPNANSINGHEWTIPNDDLQYACIFPLLPGTERDCTDPSLTSCDCKVEGNDNPLCEPDPANGNARTRQVRAKAYPALRQLTVLRDLAEQAAVASVCPPQVDDASPDAKDFGYRSVVAPLLDRLVLDIHPGCPSPAAPLDEAGRADCTAIEVFHAHDGECICDPATGRVPVDPHRQCLAESLLTREVNWGVDWNCACEIVQLDGEAGEACRNDPSNAPKVGGEVVNGYCYIDATLDPPIGNPNLVAYCPQDDERSFRFVGAGAPHPGSGVKVVCADGRFY